MIIFDIVFFHFRFEILKLLFQSVWNGSKLTASHAKLAIISEK